MYQLSQKKFGLLQPAWWGQHKTMKNIDKRVMSLSFLRSSMHIFNISNVSCAPISLFFRIEIQRPRFLTIKVISEKDASKCETHKRQKDHTCKGKRLLHRKYFLVWHGLPSRVSID